MPMMDLHKELVQANDISTFFSEPSATPQACPLTLSVSF
jgi:hypothetical protein